MIKPDGVQRNVVGNIIGRFEAKGYQLKVAHWNIAPEPIDL
jgi:nucleoside diphosphate kinase